MYNYIILHTKHYIYTYKKQGKSLDLYELLLNIKCDMNLKLKMYRSQNKEQMFRKYWDELYDAL